MVMLHIRLNGITNAKTWWQIFYTQPLPTLRMGPNWTFSEHGQVASQIKWNSECSSMVAYILPRKTLTLTPGGPNSFFSEHGLVEYQIKGNLKSSNILVNILPADPLPSLVVGSKGLNSFFSEHGRVAYHIKGNHECNSMVANILPQTSFHYPRPWGWGPNVKIHLYRAW